MIPGSSSDPRLREKTMKCMIDNLCNDQIGPQSNPMMHFTK